MKQHPKFPNTPAEFADQYRICMIHCVDRPDPEVKTRVVSMTVSLSTADPVYSLNAADAKKIFVEESSPHLMAVVCREWYATGEDPVGLVMSYTSTSSTTTPNNAPVKTPIPISGTTYCAKEIRLSKTSPIVRIATFTDVFMPCQGTSGTRSWYMQPARKTVDILAHAPNLNGEHGFTIGVSQNPKGTHAYITPDTPLGKAFNYLSENNPRMEIEERPSLEGDGTVYVMPIAEFNTQLDILKKKVNDQNTAIQFRTIQFEATSLGISEFDLLFTIELMFQVGGDEKKR